MGRIILTLNCGSSSIKFSVFTIDNDKHLYHGIIDQIGSKHTHLSYTAYNTLHGKAYPGMDMQGALECIFQLLTEDPIVATDLVGIGHRVVHGGATFTAPTRINPEILAALQATIPLAPLHNPNNIMGIELAMRFFPTVPNIAVFDRLRTIPDIASTYAIDRKIATKYHIVMGFMG